MQSLLHSPPRLLVLYGSETGTAQDVAEHVAQQAAARCLPDTHVTSMDALPLAKLLPRCDIVVFVASTTGDGEPPENMRATWRALLRRSLPPDWLRGVGVAVFGLGDSSYAKYNATARKLHARLLQLGASELVERGLGDDQHEFGYFGALNPWLGKLWDAVLRKYSLPDGFVVDDSPRPLEPQYSVVVHTSSDTAARDAVQRFTPRTDTSTFYAPPSAAVNAAHGICLAPVVANTRITAADWTQDVRHIEFDVSGDSEASVTYAAGAIADVYPENVWGVDEMIAYVSGGNGESDNELKLTGDTVVSILAADGRSPQSAFPSPTTVRDVFAKYLDILGTPRRSFFAKLSLFAADAEEKEKLEELASAEGVDLLYDYCIREKKTYSEVLLDFRSARVPLALLLQLIPRLRPRSYSISSSPLLHPGRVHLTVAIVDFLTPYKRRRSGICSAFFRALDPEKQAVVVPIWIKTGLFSLPSRDQHMLLIGPGTGLAVMRAIMQERAVLRATAVGEGGDVAIGDTHVYFGSRHENKDFLYGEELRRAVQSGDLTSLHTAFSRDQSHKIYVQTRLAENKDDVFALLTNGGYVYIAGSAKRMPSDVYEVLRDILRSVGRLPLKDAEAFLKAMVRTKREAPAANSPPRPHSSHHHGPPHVQSSAKPGEATETDARVRARGEARRAILSFGGSVWDAVKARKLELVRCFFVAEGAQKLLRRRSPDFSDGGRSLGDVPTAHFLLEAGAAVNAIDSVPSGATPLLEAARAGHSNVCELLLQNGANAAHRDAHGDTAFHWAARRGHGSLLVTMALQLRRIEGSSALDGAWKLKVGVLRSTLLVFSSSKRVGGSVLVAIGTATEKRKPRFPTKDPARMVEAGPSTPSTTRSQRSVATLPPTPDAFDGLSTARTFESKASSRAVTPLTGVQELGLDVASFTYKIRDDELASR
ncbi:hypothetical protein PybrP1_009883 [[Pythium] brassicae (nom. inval.)]|nr:hypothetical protein PybrP1_009883 [[Pythium] brassicae (nom. inval.)]